MYVNTVYRNENFTGYKSHSNCCVAYNNLVTYLNEFLMNNITVPFALYVRKSWYGESTSY